MIKTVNSDNEMKAFGERLGGLLRGGQTIELVGDVGAGKTTLTKGIAKGLGVSDDIQSPSFTISRVYEARDGLQLVHYDFYRLNDAGIMSSDIAETIHDSSTVTIIEWAGVVHGVLPENRLTIDITAPTEATRELHLSGPEELLKQLDN